MSPRTLTAAFAACLFLLIVGAKWATFEKFGSPMPDWDQWDAEAVELFIPWFENDRFLSHLFHPHNEHRVILTKLHSLALGLLNGQWDSRLEAVTNAVLHAALGVAFWLWSRRCTAARWHAPLFLLAAALFGLPFAWQNVLGGFHSQQYWLLALSFTAIVALPFAPAWSGRWWLGSLAAVLALGSMGSGLLAAAAVFGVVAWRLARRETTLRATWPTLTLALVVVGVGLVTRVHAPWHEDLKAKTLRDFFFSIVHSLEWPFQHQHWAALVLWLPWLLVGWHAVRTGGSRREPGDALPAPLTILALGGWVLVQVAATAYARGVGADYPASRYMDTLAFGTMANAVAAAWLASQPQSRAGAVGYHVVALAWLATLSFGLHDVTRLSFGSQLPDAKKYYVKAEGNMRRYLGTNNPKDLAYPDIPFPDANALIERLAKPSLRALMPVPIRAPLALAPAPGPTPFMLNDARGADTGNPPRAGLSPETSPLDFTFTWGSFNGAAGGAAATGTWRSAPLTASLRGWLKFETAGQTGDPNEGVALELRDARTDALLARVRPDRVPGATWRSAYVRAPRDPFVVVAHDHHPARWLAFSGPVEMGALSYWAWRATKRGMALVYLATAAAVALAAYRAMAARARPGPPTIGEVSNLTAPTQVRSET